MHTSRGAVCGVAIVIPVKLIGAASPYLFFTQPKQSMNLSGQKNLSWLDARIRETETRLVSDKKRVTEAESRGDNTAQACRMLAITSEYLNVLNMRRDLLRNKLSKRHQ
jgi:hypothetical protein